MPFNRSVLVTGGTANLGYHGALNIARKHPDYQVVLASRTDPDSAAKSINETLKQDNVTFLPLDLGSFKDIRSFAETWQERNFPPIQYLLLNAGVQFPDGGHRTKDGIEATFGINHVGHALLFHLLTNHLAETARIVVTSSSTHDPDQKTYTPKAEYTTAEALAHPPPDPASSSAGFAYYTSSKLANILWTYALHQRLQRTPGKQGITVAAFDPGFMAGTGLARSAGPIGRFMWFHVIPWITPLLRLLIGPNVHTPEESGANLAWLTTATEAVEVNGGYFEGRTKKASSKDSQDEAKQEDLWGWTVKTVAVSEEERRGFDL